MLFNTQRCCCVGSSHRWLLLLDKDANPFLISVVGETFFGLPQKEVFPYIERILEPENGEYLEVLYKGEMDSLRFSLKTLQEWLMVKAILSNNLSRTHKYAVITVYDYHRELKLAVCTRRDCRWIDLDGQLGSNDDIVCWGNLLLALENCPNFGPSVEIWDLNKYSTDSGSKRIIEVLCPRKFSESYKFYPRDLYTCRWYLVFSSDHDLFFVVRHIGEFVWPSDGEVVYESDTLTEYSTQPLACPNRIVGFDVFKLDHEEKKWIQVESLNDMMIFIGGNHWTALQNKENPECKVNAIYFTDDYLLRIDEDDYCGGHDMSVQAGRWKRGGIV